MKNYLLIIFSFFFLGCSEDDAYFSVEKSASLTQVSCMTFGDGNFRTCYGPGWSPNVHRAREKYDFYSISIEKNNPDGSSTVLHEKIFPIDEIVKNARSVDASNIVKVDEHSGLLVFNVIDPPYEYQMDILPYNKALQPTDSGGD